MRYLIVVLIHAVLFSSLAYGAPTLFLKDGTTEVGSSIWTENKKVYLSKSKEIYEYSQDEVKLDETLKYNKLGRYQVVTLEEHPRVSAPVPAASKQQRAKRGNVTPAAVRRKKPVANVAAAPVSAPSAAATVPAAAVPAVVKSMTISADSPAPPIPAPVPAAAPTAQEPAPPAVTPPAPAESESAPDKAELDRRKREAVIMMTEAVMKKDPELMKKALEMQKSAMPQQGAATQRKAGIPLYVPLMILASCLLIVIAQWILFERAGQAGWKCLVPFYNMYVLMEISGKPGWWMLLLLIPLAGAVFLLLAMLSLARKFRRSELFGVGIFILPMIFLPVLAFGGSEYE